MFVAGSLAGYGETIVLFFLLLNIFHCMDVPEILPIFYPTSELFLVLVDNK